MNTTMPDAGPAATPERPEPGAPGAASTPAMAPVGAPAPDASAPAPNSAFPRHPGETPRAFSAFLAYVQLGHGRSVTALAELLGEKVDTLRTWSSRHHWNQRIQAWNESLLHQHAESEADRQRQHVVDWVRRHVEAREQDWEAAQKLRLAAQCFLESFGDRDVERMTLAQVSRALQIAAPARPSGGHRLHAARRAHRRSASARDGGGTPPRLRQRRHGRTACPRRP